MAWKETPSSPACGHVCRLEVSRKDGSGCEREWRQGRRVRQRQADVYRLLRHCWLNLTRKLWPLCVTVSNDMTRNDHRNITEAHIQVKDAWRDYTLFFSSFIHESEAKESADRLFPASAAQARAAAPQVLLKWNNVIVWLSGSSRAGAEWKILLTGQVKEKAFWNILSVTMVLPWAMRILQPFSAGDMEDRHIENHVFPVLSYSISPLLPDEMWNCLLSIQGP